MRRLVVSVGVSALLLAIMVPAVGAPNIPREDIEELRTFGSAPMIQPGEVPGLGTLGQTRCTTSGDPTADIDLSCDDDLAPDNELAIVANPDNPDHLLAGSNDYRLDFRGATVLVRIPTGFFVSTDGGETWADGEVPLVRGALGAGDPSPAFNSKFGTAHMASLEFTCGQFAPLCTTGNITVSTSHDGGFTWDRPVIAARGVGSDQAAQEIFNDKEWLVADNDPSSPFFGRLYLVWAQFRIEKGFYDESPVFFTYSDDAGDSWAQPKEISGRNETYCTFQDDTDDVAAGEDPFECDQDQFAYPAVGPGGVLYVHFHNEQNEQAWEAPEQYESQLMVVKSTDGGATWTDPIHVVQLEDSYTAPPVGDSGDYPINVDRRTTLSGHQFRVNSAGNIAVDTSGGINDGRIYVVFADNADGTNSSATPVTDTNTFVAYSDDGGVTWSGGDNGTNTNPATRIRVDASAGSDQWFPWAAVGPDGLLRVIYMDGRVDRDLYDITLATANAAVTGFTYEGLSQQPSNPDQSIFFRARVEGCLDCATFIGDYNGLDVDSSMRAHGVWTDMRRPVLGTSLNAEDAFYARR